MLAHLGGDDRITLWSHGRSLRSHTGRSGHPDCISAGIFSFSSSICCYPLFVIHADRSVGLRRFSTSFTSPITLAAGTDIFVNLCRIHIDLQHLCMLCKFCRITKYTVTETGTYRNQKIAVELHQSLHIWFRAYPAYLHTADVSRKCAFAHQSITYRRIDLLCKLQ